MIVGIIEGEVIPQGEEGMAIILQQYLHEITTPQEEGNNYTDSDRG